MAQTYALVRGVPDSFANALVMDGTGRLDVAMAREQHAAYCARLAHAGYRMVSLPADERHPDCMFVEDTAVIIGDTAVVTRPGAMSRRGEVDPVAEILAATFPVRRITGPGTLDGGDVLVSGDKVLVGLSTRTNPHGVEQLRLVAEDEGMRLTAIPVTGVLHLKSAVLPVDSETLVVTPGTVDETLLDGFRIIPEMDDERHRFSALPLRDGTVLVTAAAPRTAELVANHGLSLQSIDVSAIQAADGGLTCMSILY